MTIEFHNYVGTFGVGLTLLAYLFLQTGKWTSSQMRFSLTNALGSGFILFFAVF